MMDPLERGGGVRMAVYLLPVAGLLGAAFMFFYQTDVGFSRWLGPPRVVYEGFESGQLPFRCSGNCPEVVRTSGARAGTHAMRSVLTQEREDPARTELWVSSDDRVVNFDPGTEYWVGVSIKLGEGFRDELDGVGQAVLLQLHYRDWKYPDVRNAQPLVLRYIGNEVRVHNEVLETYMAETSPAYGEWVDWVIHLKLDDEDGIVRVWRNGSQIVDFTGETHQPAKVDGAYLKIGNYSAQLASEDRPSGYERVTYHDELRIAGPRGSYDVVDPARGGERPVAAATSPPGEDTSLLKTP